MVYSHVSCRFGTSRLPHVRNFELRSPSELKDKVQKNGRMFRGIYYFHFQLSQQTLAVGNVSKGYI